GNSDALGLLAADAAVSAGLQVNKQVPLPTEPSAEDFEDALDAAIDDPEVDAVISVYIPPLNVSGEEIANVLAAVGEQSDKPLVTSFLGAEGVPELLRVPDVAGSTAGRGSVPSYSSVESAVRALAKVVEYAVWLRSADGETPWLSTDECDPRTARKIVTDVLAARPAGGDLSREDLGMVLAAYGIKLWNTHSVSTLEEAIAAGEDLGWGVVLKATVESVRERPDQAHVVRNIDDVDEMTEAWDLITSRIPPETGGFTVQRTAPPGVPVAIRSMEDPLFGPVVSFGIAGPITELVADKAYRIPPLSERDAASMVREIKAAPMLFGYRGGDMVDVDEIERLVLRVAQLQNDLPQISSLDLSLVLVGLEGSAVLTAGARVDLVADPRSDWFVRRLNPAVGDTLPG
ncbi:acetate--CoA ligase family protein, partial [Nocardioides sp. NPDC000441]